MSDLTIEEKMQVIGATTIKGHFIKILLSKMELAEDFISEKGDDFIEFTNQVLLAFIEQKEVEEELGYLLDLFEREYCYDH